ncbi:MAG: PilN domain-containing protein [Myxococcales bacterium]|jgi:Tfp pilus assembly protein PilN|nr:PilN domain-containing protein [Myxococcales bacterium]
MIKINLVPQRKVKRASEPGMKDVWVGAGAVLAATAAIVGLLHVPRQRELSKLEEANEVVQRELATLKESLKGFDELKKAAEAATIRGEAIETLLAAKIVPAYVLQELGAILTPGKDPTMTMEMSQRIKSDPNRQLDQSWDPKHVWIISFADKEGVFKLEGGAQSDGDVNQFAKRLQASAYFADVTPMRSERVLEQGSNISYNRFTITGKLVY